MWQKWQQFSVWSVYGMTTSLLQCRTMLQFHWDTHTAAAQSPIATNDQHLRPLLVLTISCLTTGNPRWNSACHENPARSRWRHVPQLPESNNKQYFIQPYNITNAIKYTIEDLQNHSQSNLINQAFIWPPGTVNGDWYLGVAVPTVNFWQFKQIL